MHPRRFDAMTRLLAVPAHRRTVLRGVVIGGILGRVAAPAPVSAVAQQTGACLPATGTSPFPASGNPRYAETFIAAVGGKLSRVGIAMEKTVESTGDFVVALHSVDPATGLPTKVLASKKVANSSVADGLSGIGVWFKKRKTTKLVAGKTYAVVLSRPTGSGDGAGFAVSVAVGDPCADNNFFFSDQQTSAFEGYDPSVGVDMVFEVVVGF